MFACIKTRGLSFLLGIFAEHVLQTATVILSENTMMTLLTAHTLSFHNYLICMQICRKTALFQSRPIHGNYFVFSIFLAGKNANEMSPVFFLYAVISFYFSNLMSDTRFRGYFLQVLPCVR